VGPWREFRRDSGAYFYDPQRINGTVGAGLSADIPGGEFEAREVSPKFACRCSLVVVAPVIST